MPEPKVIRIIIFSFFLSSVIYSFGQGNTSKYLSSYQSSLGSNTTLLSGINSIHGNPAGISDENKSYVITANSEQRYFLSSLNSSFIGAITRIGSHDYIGVSFGNFGISEFQEQKLSISYSRNIGKNTFIGSTVNVYNFKIQDYGNRRDFELNLGIKSRIGQNINLGIFAENILPNKDKGSFRENTNVSAGLQYLISDDAFLVIESKTDFTNNISWSFGLKYDILDILSLQFGINSLEQGPSFGINYQINDRISVIGSVRSSQTLGISPSLSIIFQSDR